MIDQRARYGYIVNVESVILIAEGVAVVFEDPELMQKVVRQADLPPGVLIIDVESLAGSAKVLSR